MTWQLSTIQTAYDLTPRVDQSIGIVTIVRSLLLGIFAIGDHAYLAANRLQIWDNSVIAWNDYILHAIVTRD